MRGRRAARLVAIAAALAAAGVVGYGIVEQRALRTRWELWRMQRRCEELPLEPAAFRAWQAENGEAFWSHALRARELGGAEVFFRRMATGARVEVVAAALAVTSIEGSLWDAREELDRLRDQYGARIAARTASLFARDSSQTTLVNNALERSPVREIRRSR